MVWYINKNIPLKHVVKSIQQFNEKFKLHEKNADRYVVECELKPANVQCVEWKEIKTL
jgi:hypothetical protein